MNYFKKLYRQVKPEGPAGKTTVKWTGFELVGLALSLFLIVWPIVSLVADAFSPSTNAFAAGPLTLVKASDKTAAFPGNAISYTISATNNTASINFLNVTDNVPIQISVVNATAPGCAQPPGIINQTVTLNSCTINPAQTILVTINGVILSSTPAGTSFTNTATGNLTLGGSASTTSNTVTVSVNTPAATTAPVSTTVVTTAATTMSATATATTAAPITVATTAPAPTTAAPTAPAPTTAAPTTAAPTTAPAPTTAITTVATTAPAPTTAAPTTAATTAPTPTTATTAPAKVLTTTAAPAPATSAAPTTASAPKTTASLSVITKAPASNNNVAAQPVTTAASNPALSQGTVPATPTASASTPAGTVIIVEPGTTPGTTAAADTTAPAASPDTTTAASQPAASTAASTSAPAAGAAVVSGVVSGSFSGSGNFSGAQISLLLRTAGARDKVIKTVRLDSRNEYFFGEVAPTQAGTTYVVRFANPDLGSGVLRLFDTNSFSFAGGNLRIPLVDVSDVRTGPPGASNTAFRLPLTLGWFSRGSEDRYSISIYYDNGSGVAVNSGNLNTSTSYTIRDGQLANGSYFAQVNIINPLGVGISNRQFSFRIVGSASQPQPTPTTAPTVAPTSTPAPTATVQPSASPALNGQQQELATATSSAVPATSTVSSTASTSAAAPTSTGTAAASGSEKLPSGTQSQPSTSPASSKELPKSGGELPVGGLMLAGLTLMLRRYRLLQVKGNK